MTSLSTVLDVTFTAPAIAGICALQTIGGAGALLVNGSAASAGVWNAADAVTINLSLATPGMSNLIAIASTGDLHLVNFTVTGTLLKNGPPFSETIVGPNNSTVNTVNYFSSVTGVSVDGAVGTNVSVGTNGKTASRPIIMDAASDAEGYEFQIVSGTINGSLQYTFDPILDVLNTPSLDYTSVEWLTDATITSKSSGSTSTSLAFPTMASRLITASMTSAPRVKLKITKQRRSH